MGKWVKPLWVSVQLSKAGTHQWLGHETWPMTIILVKHLMCLKL